MAKWSQATRWLKLMSFVRWKGNSDWERLDRGTQAANVLAFRNWFYDRLAYIPDERIQSAMFDYYELEVSKDPATGFHQKLERGRVALATLYNKEIERVEYYDEAREGAT